MTLVGSDHRHRRARPCRRGRPGGASSAARISTSSWASAVAPCWTRPRPSPACCRTEHRADGPPRGRRPRASPTPVPAVPVVAVPTTAGTGSEATRNAVITERGPDGYKRSFRDESMVPADAVVDPGPAGDGTALAHRRQRARCAHAAARGLSPRSEPRPSPTRSRATAWRPPATACCPGTATPTGLMRPAARSQMAYAALLSGVCLANAGLGAVHGFASPLGAQLPIPHGMACGAVLWQIIRANITALTERDPGLAGPGQVRRRRSASWPGCPRAPATRPRACSLVDTLHDWVERSRCRRCRPSR